MKYQEALAQRELVIDDLPKSQQKKITELEKLVDKINEIEADATGTIKKILVENGQPVEYGETLFIIG